MKTVGRGDGSFMLAAISPDHCFLLAPLEFDAHLPRPAHPADKHTGLPLVSAVIPTRNRPDFVMRAVRSAFGQSYGDLEVMVVIDGPDPVTRDCLKTIGDLRLRVIELAENVGGSEARNIGVRAARGEWIALLDDDDEWLPGKIQLQLDAALAMTQPVVSSRIMSSRILSSRILARSPSLEFLWPRHLYRAGQPVSEYLFCRDGILEPGNVIQTSTLFLRRELMIDMPFRKGLKMHQDIDWLLRAVARPGVEVVMLPEALTVYRVDDSGKSVGRTVDWEFSTSWAREMRGYFSPKAYSWFLGAECMWRAVRSRAGLPAYWSIVREFFTQGAPTFRAALTLVISAFAQGLIPARARRLGRALRSARLKLSGLTLAQSMVKAIPTGTVPTE